MTRLIAVDDITEYQSSNTWRWRCMMCGGLSRCDKIPSPLVVRLTKQLVKLTSGPNTACKGSREFIQFLSLSVDYLKTSIVSNCFEMPKRGNLAFLIKSISKWHPVLWLTVIYGFILVNDRGSHYWIIVSSFQVWNNLLFLFSVLIFRSNERFLVACKALKESCKQKFYISKLCKFFHWWLFRRHGTVPGS